MNRVIQLGAAASLALASSVAFAGTPDDQAQATQAAESGSKGSGDLCVCKGGAASGEPQEQGKAEEGGYASERARQNALDPWFRDADAGGR